MYHIKVFQEKDKTDELSYGRHYISIYDKLPYDQLSLWMPAFDFELLYETYVKQREKLGDVRCDKCGYFSNDKGNCPNCSKKLKKV